MHPNHLVGKYIRDQPVAQGRHAVTCVTYYLPKSPSSIRLRPTDATWNPASRKKSLALSAPNSNTEPWICTYVPHTDRHRGKWQRSVTSMQPKIGARSVSSVGSFVIRSGMYSTHISAIARRFLARSLGRRISSGTRYVCVVIYLCDQCM